MQAPAIAFNGITPFLKTKDLDETIRFYVELLGFVVGSPWPADKPMDCTLDNGHVHIAFGTDPHNWYREPGLSGQLWIDVDDVMALHAKLAGKVSMNGGRRSMVMDDESSPSRIPTATS